MGRKTFISVVDREGNEVFKPEDNVVKGKNITTDFIYNCISNETKENDDSCVIWYSINKGGCYEDFKRVLKNIREMEYKEYDKLEREYDALIKCRLNTTTLKDFNEFTTAIDEQEKILNEVEEPAHKVLEILEECEKCIFDSIDWIIRDDLNRNIKAEETERKVAEMKNKYFIEIKVSD